LGAPHQAFAMRAESLLYTWIFLAAIFHLASQISSRRNLDRRAA
jgi:hypothetical protein